ncbi:unnamed protein product [Leptidea sinapis]|uniref:CHK kinase-like domain-containing protein n=1 Tax=Leptidea sinapis TaxID=189913 RepID=A0A5E4QYX7_9NEOP|nr:unnamed protein product [Leptidea sinapis]
MIISEDRLNEIVCNIAKNIGLQSWRYESQEKEDNIENYFGILIPLTLMGTIKTNEIKINIYLKVPVIDAPSRWTEVFNNIYACEAFFYGTIIPMYKSLSNFGEIDEFIPECYFTDATPGKQVIALKNMTFNGFRTYQVQKFLDFDHTISALKALAKFHAFWVILEKKGKAPSCKLLRPHTNTYPAEYNMRLKIALLNDTKYFHGSKYENYIRSLLNNFDQIRVESTTKAKRLVYGHGDYWKENILFKSKDGEPIQACMLDFQNSRLISPAQDFLSFLLYSHSSPSRHQNFDNFISVYLEQFNCILLENNTEVQTYNDEFKHDLKIVAEDCVITSFMAFALWLGLEGETLIKRKYELDRSESITHFINIVNNILDDLSNLGYISI